MTKKQIRRRQIIEVLMERNGQTIKELALELKVSEMTIRRDLQVLEANGVVKLVHGAAIYNPDNIDSRIVKEYDLLTAKNINNERKNDIAKYAAGLIDDNDFISIDIGSTTERVIPNVAADRKFSVLAFTANAMLPVLSRPNIKLLFGGGEYRKDTMTFVSEYTLNLIRESRPDKVFFSSAAIDENFGITCVNHYEGPVKKSLIESAKEKILLVDSSKLGKVEACYFTDLDQVDMIVTDRQIDEDWVDRIEKANIKLIRV